MFLHTRQRTSVPPGRPPRIARSHAAAVRALLELCPAYRPTPLLSLPEFAADSGLAAVHLKAEWDRMGLPSFKALGGVHAVARLVWSRAEAALGRSIRPSELRSSAVRSVAEGMTVICASAGNHGLAVAAGAQVFGVHAVVVLGAPVAESFASRLRRRGATVIRGGKTYEESMSIAAAQADRHGWILVSDSSWPGYTDIPLAVMHGYTVAFEEAADAMDAAGGPATHVFVQAGVGGLAAAAAGYLRDRWGEDFTFVVVEPVGAPCLTESTRLGRAVRIQGGPTALGRLDCKEPSLLAFEVLSQLADAFVLVTDAEAETAAARLAEWDAPVSACGAAGAAALIATLEDPAARHRLGLDAGARVLLVGTEATPDSIEGSPT